MVEPVAMIDPTRVSERLAEIEREIAQAAARSPHAAAATEVLAAVKYVPVDLVGQLAEGGVVSLGENRAQDLVEKQDRWGDLFAWDFIGDLQSRKVAQLAGRVRYIHSVASMSALDRLAKSGVSDQRIFIQVNVSGEGSKSGVQPGQLASFIDASPCPVVGLMTMPPLADDPQESRPYFAQLRDLAVKYGLEHLSMGTSQDYVVAVEEGATIVRIGSQIYA